MTSPAFARSFLNTKFVGVDAAKKDSFASSWYIDRKGNIRHLSEDSSVPTNRVKSGQTFEVNRITPATVNLTTGEPYAVTRCERSTGPSTERKS